MMGNVGENSHQDGANTGLAMTPASKPEIKTPRWFFSFTTVMEFLMKAGAWISKGPEDLIPWKKESGSLQ